MLLHIKYKHTDGALWLKKETLQDASNTMEHTSLTMKVADSDENL